MKNALVIWIWLCAWLNCAGWFLSAIGQLNAAGYAAMLVVAVAAFLIWKRCQAKTPGNGTKAPPPSGCCGLRIRRFKKLFPFAFLLLSAMAFLGGALHAPNNYDALAYRIPRILHWLDAGHWHWIHSVFPRLNNRSCGIEWVSTPFILFLKTLRPLFLLNLVSFLFLPGLVFGVLTRLGVRNRVAWHWMWLAPTGYCFLLQAGSLGNDLFGVPFALGAVDFALRAKISKSSRDIFASLLAVAMMTSAKTSSLPLLLPWAIAILPSLPLLLRRPLATVAVGLLALFASFAPSAALNSRYAHDWSGLSLDATPTHGSPVLRTAANITLVTLLNLAPPVFPEANRWNDFVPKAIPANLRARLQQVYIEPAAADFKLPDMQTEEDAGLGFGVTALLAISVLAAMSLKGWRNSTIISPADRYWQTAVVVAPWLSTLVLLSQSQIYGTNRALAPYYLLLLPLPLCLAGHASLVKKSWWRFSAFVVFIMAAGLLVISPARPLFPVGALLKRIQANPSPSRLMARTGEVYSVYQNRSHAFGPALACLPPGLKVLGFIGFDDPETTLWEPFGSRRIVHVCPQDRPADLKARGVEYVLAWDGLFGSVFPPLDGWLKNMNAHVVQKIHLDLRVSGVGSDWELVELN